jgi:hypothetical protein
MKNEEIKSLLLKHADLCMIIKYRELTPEEDATLAEIEEKLDALP